MSSSRATPSRTSRPRGADLKEGTDSGTLRNNTFRRVGTSGENSADSAVDAKGNNWVIEGNTVLETDAEWDDDGTMRPSEFADGLQSHSVYDGYGTANNFRANRVVGAVPGFGIGLYPGAGNIVACDNEAAEADAGLVGDHGETAAWRPAPARLTTTRPPSTTNVAPHEATPAAVGVDRARHAGRPATQTGLRLSLAHPVATVASTDIPLGFSSAHSGPHQGGLPCLSPSVGPRRAAAAPH